MILVTSVTKRVNKLHYESPLFYIKMLSNILISFFLALVPDKPRNLTITKIKSRSAEISWLDPDHGNPWIQFNITRFWIQVKKDDVLILSANTGNVYEYKLSGFTPYTMYEISVTAGNTHGFGEETNTSFLTSEEGECY
jgi:hypothetical protein